jgi:23S rRNA (guanosine2251-2'-O)-methyltransferase
LRQTLQKPRFNKSWRDKTRPGGPGRNHQNRRPGDSSRRNETRADTDDAGPVRLFGLHAVEAALKNPRRRVHRLLLTENAERRIRETISDIAPPIERVSPRDLDKLLGPDTVHQGAALEAEPLPEPEWQDLATSANGRPLIVLDQVTDPHNVGAILRSAAVFGACGLVMTRRHSPPLNGVLAKSASGALELVPVALVANLSRALDDMKSAGFTIVGLDGEGEETIEALDWAQPTALVMGSEGKGLRDLTRKTCDLLARITTDDTIASLNVSNAAAVALHSALLARKENG